MTNSHASGAWPHVFSAGHIWPRMNIAPNMRKYTVRACGTSNSEGGIEMTTTLWRLATDAPPENTVVDVWLDDADPGDVAFYCTPGTRFSAGWRYRNGVYKPEMGLKMPVFVQPTHWKHLDPGPGGRQ